MPGVCIAIDHRERGAGLAAELLRTDPGRCVLWSHLRLGDYLVGSRLLIERKSLPDLCASIKDGRLFDQAKRMADLLKRNRRAVARPKTAAAACARDADAVEAASSRRAGSSVLAEVRACALLVEGRVQALEDSQMALPAIRAALASVALFIGVPVLRSGSAAESAQLLWSLEGQLRRFSDAALPRPGLRPKGKRGLQLYLLQGLPGIGPQRAARLLDRFGSVRAVLTAECEALAAVEGIGPGTAGRIIWSVTGEAGA